MRLSSRTEYALLALIFLARLPAGKFAHGQDIADAQKIPMSFLQQILFALKQARLVRSVKGRAGGYALNRDASKITLAEVVRLFDGPLAPSRTVSKLFHEQTPIAGERKVTAFLREIRDYLSEKLENATLRDMC
jgi:Rrf2 family cysteine metabolism transcriptional repressor